LPAHGVILKSAIIFWDKAMKPRINIKVQQISDGCYRAFSDELDDLVVEGSTVWETLEAARRVVRGKIESGSAAMAG